MSLSEGIREENARMRAALENLLTHHIDANNRVGRPLYRSQTLKFICDGLGRPHYTRNVPCEAP